MGPFSKLSIKGWCPICRGVAVSYSAETRVQSVAKWPRHPITAGLAYSIRPKLLAKRCLPWCMAPRRPAKTGNMTTGQARDPRLQVRLLPPPFPAVRGRRARPRFQRTIVRNPAPVTPCTTVLQSKRKREAGDAGALEKAWRGVRGEISIWQEF